jgi:chromosome segregation ATPase
MEVSIPAETITWINESFPNDEPLPQKIQMMCEYLSQSSEISQQALSVIDKYEKEIASLKLALSRHGELSVATLEELRGYVAENERLRQELDQAIENRQGLSTFSDETEQVRAILDSLAECCECSPGDLETQVGRISSEHRVLKGIVQRVCAVLKCQPDGVESALRTAILERGNGVCEVVTRTLQCQESAIPERLEALLTSETIVNMLAAQFGVEPGDLVRTLSVSPDERELSKLREQCESVIAERDALHAELSQIEAVRRNARRSLEHFHFVFDRFPDIAAEATHDSEHALWDAHYELQNTLSAMESLHKTTAAERERLEQEVSQIRIEAMQMEARAKDLEAENTRLQSQLEGTPEVQLLKQLRRSLACANDSEIYQKVVALNAELLVLRAGKQAQSIPLPHGELTDPTIELREKIASLEARLADRTRELKQIEQEIVVLRPYRTQLIERDQELAAQRSAAIELEHQCQVAKGELRVIGSQLREAQRQLEATSNASTQLSSRLGQFSRMNKRYSSVCDALQVILSQFSMFEFADQGADDLFSALSNLQGGSVPTAGFQRFGAFLEKKMKALLQKVSALERRFTALNQKVRALATAQEKLVGELRAKEEELNEFMDQDLAPKVASLQVQLRSLQDRRPTAGNMTPPRVHWDGAHGQLSPSDVTLEATIQQHRLRGPW